MKNTYSTAGRRPRALLWSMNSGGTEDVVEMPDRGEEAQPAESPRGEAGWKAHKQWIAAANDRTQAAGKRQRREREQRASDRRKVDERREDAEFARKLHARQPT